MSAAKKVEDKLRRCLKRSNIKLAPSQVNTILQGVVREAGIETKKQFDEAFESEKAVQKYFSSISSLKPHLDALTAVVNTKDACAPNPMLDNFLTVLFLTELAFLLLRFATEPDRTLVLVFFACLCGAAAVVELSKAVFEIIGRGLCRLLVARGFVDESPLQSHTQMKKWKEQVEILLLYALSAKGCLELAICRSRFRNVHGAVPV